MKHRRKDRNGRSDEMEDDEGCTSSRDQGDRPLDGSLVRVRQFPPAHTVTYLTWKRVRLRCMCLHACNAGHSIGYVNTLHVLLSKIFKTLTTTSKCKASGDCSPDNVMRNIQHGRVHDMPALALPAQISFNTAIFRGRGLGCYSVLASQRQSEVYGIEARS